jgi:chromosome segregation ATPase
VTSTLNVTSLGDIFSPQQPSTIIIMASSSDLNALEPNLMKLKMTLEKLCARFEQFPEDNDARTISAGVTEVYMIIELLFKQAREAIDMKNSAKDMIKRLEQEKKSEVQKVTESREAHKRAEQAAEVARKELDEKRMEYEKKLAQLERDSPKV